VPLSDTLSEEIHSDVWGPSPVPSLGGRRYYVTFTDDFSCHTWLTTICMKDEILVAYKAYVAWLSTQHRVKIKRLHLDHGGEYIGEVFSMFLVHFIIWLKNHSITHVLGDATGTSHEHLTRCKPNLADLLEWGQHVWVDAGKSLKLRKHAMLTH
jgi:hypothetical protein